MTEWRIGQLVVEFDWDSYQFWLVFDSLLLVMWWIVFFTVRAWLRYRRDLKAWREQGEESAERS
ncbi:MAG TPA: hypothetical protein VFB08_16560 [Burkholderiales bacterium]|nr:hypothetical protein [Burkholderiales bacterium]